MFSTPFFIVAIVMIFVVFPSVVFSGIAKIKRAQGEQAPPNSVGMRELEDRIRQIVEKANEPIRDEIRALEERLEAALEDRALTGRDDVPELPQSTAGRVPANR